MTKTETEKEVYQLQSLVDQMISINEGDQDQTTNAIKFQWHRIMILRLFLYSPAEESSASKTPTNLDVSGGARFEDACNLQEVILMLQLVLIQ